MMGELLAHLLIKHYVEDLEPISIYFNKEERSIKKGFDLNFINMEKKAVWYGEVKSGGVNGDDDCDKANTKLLDKSKKDLQGFLSGERQNLWHSALIDVGLTLANEHRTEVKDLLKGDIREIKSTSDTKKNGVLVSVLFHDIDNKICPLNLSGYLDSVVEQGVFQEILAFSIQKNTFRKIRDFLIKDIGK